MAEFFTDAFHQGIWIVFVTLFWQRKISRIQAYFLFWGVIPLPGSIWNSYTTIFYLKLYKLGIHRYRWLHWPNGE